MSDPKKAHEVDLLDLILSGVRLIRANFLLIILFFLLGSAIGLAYFFASKKVYQSKMIISSGILTASFTRILFDNANVHLSDGNTAALAAQFHISEKAAREINALKLENVAGGESTELKEADRYLITVEVLDQQILPELQKGIIDYLENNEFVKVRVEQNKSFLRQMLATVEKEIKDLEDLKSKIYSGAFFESSKSTMMFDPTSVDSKIIELTEKKIGYQNSLQLANSVQVIEGFTRFENQVRPKFSLSLTAGSFVGLLFVGLLIAFKSIRKLLRMAEANDKSHAA